jgi:hypothetical protein
LLGRESIVSRHGVCFLSSEIIDPTNGSGTGFCRPRTQAKLGRNIIDLAERSQSTERGRCDLS